MMIDEESQLPVQLQRNICQFQSYVCKRYSSKEPKWPLAKRRIQDVADSVVSTLEFKTLPIDLTQVAQLFDVKVSTCRTLGNVLGQLIPTRTGFEIVIADGANRYLSTRCRFTFAHELGHTLFFLTGRHGPERIFPRQIAAGSSLARKEEGLCDSFAAALLVPRSFLSCFRSKSPTMAEIIHASLRFEVTPDVMIRRLLHDFDFLEDKIVYGVRLSRGDPVTVFRGPRADKKLPTGNRVRLLLAPHDRTQYISTLKKEPIFADCEFCIYAGRTLYFIA